MDLRIPCNWSSSYNNTSSICQKPSHFRTLPLNRIHHLNPRINHHRRKSSTRAELQSSTTSTTTITTTGISNFSDVDSYSLSSSSSTMPLHKVTVHDRQRGVSHEFLVPEDQYILHTAESQNISLPFACRHGCCTSCAVRIKSGEIRQPEALGISAELKSKGYALLCVGFPTSDIEVETQDEDEVYWLQFGRYFARGPIERDDYALELAMGDE